MDCNFREVGKIKCPTFLGRDLQRNKNNYYTLIALFVYLRFIKSQFNLWRVGNKRSQAPVPVLQQKLQTQRSKVFFVTVQTAFQVIYPTHAGRIIVSSGDKTQQVTANLDKPSETFLPTVKPVWPFWFPGQNDFGRSIWFKQSVCLLFLITYQL